MNGWMALLTPPLWWWLFGGLLGSLVFWLVGDWLYWRRRLKTRVVEWEEVVQSTSRELKGERDQLQRNLTAIGGERDQLQGRYDLTLGERDRLQRDLTTASTENQQLQAKFAMLRGEHDQLQGTLTTLRGERDMLQHELAAVSSEREALQGRYNQMVDDLATVSGEHEQLQGSLATLRGEREQLQNNFALLGGERDQLQSNFALLGGERDRLHGEHEQARAEIASLRGTVDSDRQQISALQTRIAELEAEHETTRAALDESRNELAQAKQKSDRLVDVNGIGPVYQQRLYDAGVRTFAQLSTMPSEDLDAIIKPEEWQQLDYATWRSEAQILAGGGKIERERKVRQRRVFRSARDRLERIAGITDQYEQRLWAAGILTYDQLSRRPEAEIREILGLSQQAGDVRFWIQEARRLAKLRAELVEYSFEADDPRRTITEVIETATVIEEIAPDDAARARGDE